MLSLGSLTNKELQHFKAILTEYKNNGNDSIDGILFEIERLTLLLKPRLKMSPEAIVKARKRKEEKLKRKKSGELDKPTYRNICDSCKNGEIVEVRRDGILYEVCGRMIDNRLQVGCGYSKMLEK